MIHIAIWLSKWNSYTKSKGYQHMNFDFGARKIGLDPTQVRIKDLVLNISHCGFDTRM
jgi:hypothetical protein